VLEEFELKGPTRLLLYNGGARVNPTGWHGTKDLRVRPTSRYRRDRPN